MFDRQWVYRAENPERDSEGQEVQPQLPRFIKALLLKRGISGEAACRRFLHPALEDMADPFLLPDMEAAVERILQAADSGEKAAVFGDYDADGITAAAIVYHFLKNTLEMDIVYMLPDRFGDGYGISETAVRTLAQQGVTLIITVDNGISAYAELALAAELGVDAVVTDHHACGETLPDCCAVVNPGRGDHVFPCKCLAGVGVAYMLVSAIGISIGLEQETQVYLPIAAIGTIGDSVPLTEENRILVKCGLERLCRNEWPGLGSLMKKVRMKCDEQNPPRAASVAFQLVPKLNAAGRMGSAARALELLLAEDEAAAEKLADTLIEENTARQETERCILAEASDRDHLKSTDADCVVVSMGEGWHPGVIGIVASRMMEKYRKPAIILTSETRADGSAVARGSARSPGGMHLQKALSACGSLLLRSGGHEKAAGLEMDPANIPQLIAELNAYAKAHRAEWEEPLYTEIDVMVAPEEITIENAAFLSCLEPFGEGNPDPVLCTSGLEVERCAKVGEGGRHLKLSLISRENGITRRFDGIAFQGGGFADLLTRIGAVSILYRMEVGVWAARPQLSLIISDIHDFPYAVDNHIKCVYNKGYITCASFVLSRESLSAMYKVMRKYGDSFTFGDLPEIRDQLRRAGYACTWYMLRMGLDVFLELGLAQKNGKSKYLIPRKQEKVELSGSRRYRMLERASETAVRESISS